MIDKYRPGTSGPINGIGSISALSRPIAVNMKFISPPMQRLLAGLALIGAFLVMASVFVPLDTGAEPLVPLTPFEPHIPSPQSELDGSAPPWPSVDPHEGLRSLGSLEQGSYIVFIYATEGGPRYTVYERSNNQEIATLLSAERVQELFPELPLPSIDFSGPRQIMLAPTNTFDY
jgi:hypothetical protein